MFVLIVLVIVTENKIVSDNKNSKSVFIVKANADNSKLIEKFIIFIYI